MNKQRIWSVMMAVAVIVGLAACGGGGGCDDCKASGGGLPEAIGGLPEAIVAPLPPNPGLLVAPGQASKTINLLGCTRFIDGVTDFADLDIIQTATLVLSANGDMVFSGAPRRVLMDNTVIDTTVTELGRIQVANLVESAFSFEVDGDFLLLQIDSGTKVILKRGSFFNRRGAPLDQCSGVPPFPELDAVVRQNLNQIQARFVQTGVTLPAGSSAEVELLTTNPSRRTGDIVSWDTGAAGIFARYASFNLATAQLGQGNSLDPSTHTPVPYTLPASGSGIRGYYLEQVKQADFASIRFAHGNIAFTFFNSPGSDYREFNDFASTFEPD